MTNAALLEIDNLSVAYGKAEVVHSVSLRLGAGEFVAVLGRNGAGKSTMLKAVSGLIGKRGGRVRFRGQDITEARPRDIVGQGLVHVLEGHRVFGSLTVDSNLRLGLFGGARGMIRRRLAEVYELFPEMAERRQVNAARLSGGQQQILAVAQGIIADPRLLILDEPSFGLAPLIVDRILDLAVALCRKGVTIVLVEQLVEKALGCAQRAVLMETGRIVHSGPSAELLGSGVLSQIYLGGGAR